MSVRRETGLKMDVGRRKESYQADCFTPKKSLARTPPKRRQETENVSPCLTKDQCSLTSTNKGRTQDQREKNGKSEAQSTRSSEIPVLKERNSQEDDTCRRSRRAVQQETVVDDIPPPSRWEIPRTPVRIVEHVQLHVSSKGAICGATPSQRTPVRMKQPFHPLAHSNKATPPPRPPIRAAEKGTLTVSELESRKTEQCTAKDENPLQDRGDCASNKERITSTLGYSSPPISVTKGIGTLPGLHCTENDLAFLQRMQTLKEYEELKAEAEQLEKTHKTAAEQKELFEHEVLKIQQDLQNMKLSYDETSSVVVSLISSEKKEGLINSDVQCSSKDLQPPESGQIKLTKAQLAQLHKLNQLSSARVEKTEKEVKGKLVEVERAKWQIQSKIRQEEARKLEEKAQLQSICESTKQEQEKWKQKVEQEEENYTSLKNQLSEAQSQLAVLQQEQTQIEERVDASTSDREQSVSVCAAADERKRTEKRLKRLIRRCELYIKRHEMLREMGVKM